MNRRLLALALASTCPACALLTDPNPEFIESGSDTQAEGSSEGVPPDASEDASEGGPPDACELGWLDCDDEPGCESDPDDPNTCGSCWKDCDSRGSEAAWTCSEGVCTASVIFSGFDDTYLDGEQPDANFGAEPVLRVDAAREAHLLLSDVSVPPTMAVESVELRLSCSLAGAAIGVYETVGDWSEASLTKNNAPGLGGAPLLSFTPALGDNAIELLDAIPEWQMAEAKRGLGLRLLNPRDPAASEFSSAEGPIPPTIVVTLSW